MYLNNIAFLLQFLFPVYQILASNTNETFFWGGWSQWSACSEPCGRGLSNRTRHCNRFHKYTTTVENSKCGSGPNILYKVCKNIDCLYNSESRISSQCNKLNTRSFRGRRYRWSVYLHPESTCKLTCKADRVGYVIQLSDIAINGTSCDKAHSRICLKGVCRQVGCDDVIDSQITEDKCGVCNGDGTSCRRVSGLYTRPFSKRGYTHITTIPSYARNLSITELKRSRNYLALRVVDGPYLFNGHWRLSRTRNYRIGDSIVSYQRAQGSQCPGQCVQISKSTNTTLHLQLLSFGRNPGIKYSFIVPSDSPYRSDYENIVDIDSKNRRKNNHRKIHSNRKLSKNYNKQFYERTNATIGQKTSFRRRTYTHKPITSVKIEVKKRKTLYQPKDNTFLNGKKPYNPWQQVRQLPLRSRLSYSWKVSGLTKCSKSCGGGVQRTKVICVDSKTHAIITDGNCDVKQKPSTPKIICNNIPCAPGWANGEWSDCSVSCGVGYQTRRVRCEQVVSATLVIRVKYSRCNRFSRPTSRQLCKREPCARWNVLQWSNCSVECGKGQRTRKVTCVSAKDDVIEDFPCQLAEEKPTVTEICDMGSCVKDWYHTPWSQKCSVDCGRGYLTRNVFCSADDGRNIPASKCPGSKPPKTRTCKVHKPCGGKWFTGPWTQCTATCGKSVQNRDVVCIKRIHEGFFTIVDNGNCNSATKPMSTTPCEKQKQCPPTWYMTSWSNCSQTCNTGYKTRGVKCLTTSLKPTLGCNDKSRPLTRRSCNTHSCDQAQLDKDPLCQDSNKPFCLMVVQARMCKYSFYKIQCCFACSQTYRK